MANTKLIAGAIIVLLIVIGAAVYLAQKGGKQTTTTSPLTTQAPASQPATQTTQTAPSETTTPTQTQASIKVVKIGALLPLTGDLASFGKANEESILLAEKDINKYLEEKGANWRIKIVIVDTATDPATAKERFDTLYQQGIRFFIGPMTSAELAQIVSLIQQGYKAVVISQSSTAPSLALKDTVFRFPPPDEFQGKVLAKLYQKDGVTHVIMVYRNDDWGSGLAGYIEKYAKAAGINIVQKIPYDPKAANFANVVEQIKTAVENLLNKGVPASKIGVELIGFDETANILEQANNYDVLKKVKWYGSDGSALSQAVLQSPGAAEFAAMVNWKNTITFSISDKTARVYCTLKKKLGYSPDPYSLIAYDAVWAMALAIEKAGGPDATPDAVAKAIPEVLKNYVGVSGKIVLNEYGDRAGSDYGIFTVVKTDDKYEWRLIELYKFEKDDIVPVQGNPLSCEQQ
jgi:branched-chain amino acid transport system substrate-binding protein